MARQRKRSNDPAALRARVLDVASAAFQSGGYHATSTHDIMREARVSGGAFHHHFSTKKSLALAVLRERVAPAVATAWITPVREAGGALDGVLRAFETIALALDSSGKVLGCPLNNLAVELSLADPEFQAAVCQIFAGWRQAIAEKAEAERVRLPGAMSPAEFATLVVASYSGAIAMAKAQQSTEPLRTCARQLATLFCPSDHGGRIERKQKAPKSSHLDVRRRRGSRRRGKRPATREEFRSH